MAYKIRFQKGPESVGFFLNADLTDSTDLDGSEKAPNPFHSSLRFLCDFADLRETECSVCRNVGSRKAAKPQRRPGRSFCPYWKQITYGASFYQARKDTKEFTKITSSLRTLRALREIMRSWVKSQFHAELAKDAKELFQNNSSN